MPFYRLRCCISVLWRVWYAAFFLLIEKKKDLLIFLLN
jgi:hypothetical protein